MPDTLRNSGAPWKLRWSRIYDTTSGQGWQTFITHSNFLISWSQSYSMKISSVFVAAFLFSATSFSQNPPSIKRIDPPNWWTGMKNSNIQLLVYGHNAGTLTYEIGYPGVMLAKQSKVENSNSGERNSAGGCPRNAACSFVLWRRSYCRIEATTRQRGACSCTHASKS